MRSNDEGELTSMKGLQNFLHSSCSLEIPRVSAGAPSLFITDGQQCPFPGWAVPQLTHFVGFPTSLVTINLDPTG